MTGDDVDPSFDDPSHDAIRALLRDARADEPVPADVAARLDATLAAMSGQRAPETEEPMAEVVALRRRAPRMRPLVAAAAVIVIGVGGGGLAVSLANQNSHGPASAVSASAGKATNKSEPFAPLPHPPSGLNPQTLSKDSVSGQLDLALRPAAFTTAGFAHQAAAFAATSSMRGTESSSGTAGTGTGTSGTAVPGAASATPPQPNAVPPTGAPSKAAGACVTPNVPAAEIVPITLDGLRASLVLHPVSGGTQLIEAWSCDGTHVLAHATVKR